MDKDNNSHVTCPMIFIKTTSLVGDVAQRAKIGSQVKSHQNLLKVYLFGFSEIIYKSGAGCTKLG